VWYSSLPDARKCQDHDACRASARQRSLKPLNGTPIALALLILWAIANR
jgi:hypothetical protein